MISNGFKIVYYCQFSLFSDQYSINTRYNRTSMISKNNAPLDLDKISRLILDAIHDGILIIDKNSIVRYINPAYTRITGVPLENIVGKEIREVRPGARLPSVLKSGENILRALRLEDDIEYLVNMAPIISEKQIIGAISVVKAIDDAFEISNRINRYQKEIHILKKHIKSIQKARYFFSDIVAEDPLSQELKNLAEKVSQKDTTVLISGESGTGKELYAQAIHNGSSRKDGPFIVLNCATMNHSLLESELFGYAEGSFTGAAKEGKVGLFEAAHRGTIFLDEISEIEISLQAKLLRTLQENTVRRIGSVKEIPIDVRVITATNKDLEEMIQEGTFKQDLYYRIAVFPLEIPPLRERRRDIPALTTRFLSKRENKVMRRIDITDEAVNVLTAYNWPGNIRELSNSIEFAFNMMTDYTIDTDHLPNRIKSYYLRNHKGEKMPIIENLADVLKKVEIQTIEKRLELFGHDLEGKKQAAASLGISLATLYNKLKEISK